MEPLRPTREAGLRAVWYPVARSDAVGASPVGRRLLEEALVLWREEPDGPVSAAYDRCPHRGAMLSKGQVTGGLLTCPYHGWAYGLDGSCRHVPQMEPGLPTPSGARLRILSSAEQWGWVWVWLAESPPSLLPSSSLVPELGSEWRVIHEPESEWACPAFHLIDNNLDIAHIPFVHAASFGGQPGPITPVHVEARPYGLFTRLVVPVESRPGEQGATERRVEQDLILPLLLVSRISYPDGVVQIMIKAAVPVGDRETRQLQVVLRNDSESARPSADIVAFDSTVWDEDHEVLSACSPDFHLDLRAEVHLKSDRASLEYRRRLAALLRA